MSFISANHSGRPAEELAPHHENTRPTAEPDLDPGEDAAGLVSQGPTRQLGWCPESSSEAGKGWRLCPRENPVTSLGSIFTSINDESSQHDTHHT